MTSAPSPAPASAPPPHLPGADPSAWSARGPLLLGGLCLVVLLGGFGAWATLTQIAAAVIAQGRVEVAQSRQVVQHPDGGVVAEIAVEEGDEVAAGDLLIRLDAEALRSELAVIEGQLLEVLARRARFEAEEMGADALAFDPLLAESENPVAAGLMAGSQRLFLTRRETALREAEQLDLRRAQTADQIEGIEAQIEAARRQAELVAREVEVQRGLLDRGQSLAARLLELESEAASLDGRLGELAAAKAEAEERITETGIELLRLESERREEASSRLRDLQFNEIELSEQRRALLVRLDRLDVRAPVAGIVYGLLVFAPRSVIRAADPLLYLVPQDRPLVVTTQIEPIHVDEVHVGQEVALRLSAFDQRVTPELVGRVTQVSADAFEDEASRLSFYRASIEIEEGEVEKLPPGLTLLPGMPVEAFIRTGERSPLQYFLKPLTDYFVRAFRES